MADTLRPLSPVELRNAASISDRLAHDRWDSALTAPGNHGPALISLLDDWAEYSGGDYRSLLGSVFAAQGQIDAEWTDRQPSDAKAAAEFYDQTDTLIPLLLWWHGTDLNPARCATGAAGVLKAIGGRRVLDFGCGIGSTALLLAQEGAEVLLADVAEEPLRFAEWRLRRRGHEPTCVRLLDESLDQIEAGSCDAIVSFDVFEHLPDPVPSLESLDRVLAPGGAICLNQAYVPANDEPQHYPQRGEVLGWLHQHGYRLAHLTSVCWVAQKGKLPAAARVHQGTSLRARIAATHLADAMPAPLRRRLGFHIVRHALR